MDGEYIKTKTVALEATDTQQVEKPNFHQLGILCRDCMVEYFGCATADFNATEIELREAFAWLHSSPAALAEFNKDGNYVLFAYMEEQVTNLELELKAKDERIAELENGINSLVYFGNYEKQDDGSEDWVILGVTDNHEKLNFGNLCKATGAKVIGVAKYTPYLKLINNSAEKGDGV